MQADEPRGSRASTGAFAERFDARDGAGRVFVIEKLDASAHENAIGGLEWTGPGVRYQLEQGGGEVERIDESLFRVVGTGELLRREEGKHGITHHPEHQSPSAAASPGARGETP